MRTPLRLVVGLVLATCVATARAELAPVPFIRGRQQFKPGDAIMIDQILASTPELAVGTQVVVRGHYRLASAKQARLGFFVTHRLPGGPEAPAPSQVARIESPNGRFELSYEIAYAGAPHVSFYPIPDGEEFGGIYFSVPAAKVAPY